MKRKYKIIHHVYGNTSYSIQDAKSFKMQQDGGFLEC
jgi:hypothetical protein